jgi:hypothetical protein
MLTVTFSDSESRPATDSKSDPRSIHVPDQAPKEKKGGRAWVSVDLDVRRSPVVIPAKAAVCIYGAVGVLHKFQYDHIPSAPSGDFETLPTDVWAYLNAASDPYVVQVNIIKRGASCSSPLSQESPGYAIARLIVTLPTSSTPSTSVKSCKIPAKFSTMTTGEKTGTIDTINSKRSIIPADVANFQREVCEAFAARS